jgi:hypothetical protein
MNSNVRVLALWLVSAVTPATHGATLFSTLGQLDQYVTSSTFANDQYATDFRTGSSPSTITSLVIPLRNQDIISHNWRTAIHTSAGGLPGILVAEFDNTITMPANEAVFTPRTFTSTGIELDDETTYWVVFRQIENGTSSSNTRDVDMTGNFGNAVDAGSVFSAESSTLVQRRIGASPWSPYAMGNLRYALEGTIEVPEPGCLVLGSVAGAALLFLRRQT